ncbi:MAG: heavy-metal-associated domain-containing protein [Deltaproteobacteria bacterium]|nr:heavy-metal-associated domain-containing protein [Deltaproteobacteria bacterium]
MRNSRLVVRSTRCEVSPSGLSTLLFSALAALLVTACSESATPKKLTIAIEGMHCAGCVTAIEGAIKPMPGVRSVKVSLQQGQATVVTQPKTGPSAKTLIATINKLGYHAKLLAGGCSDQPASESGAGEAGKQPPPTRCSAQ